MKKHAWLHLPTGASAYVWKSWSKHMWLWLHLVYRTTAKSYARTALRGQVTSPQVSSCWEGAVAFPQLPCPSTGCAGGRRSTASSQQSVEKPSGCWCLLRIPRQIAGLQALQEHKEGIWPVLYLFHSPALDTAQHMCVSRKKYFKIKNTPSTGKCAWVGKVHRNVFL